MLVMPPGASALAPIAGVDPGTETLGVGVLFVDLVTWKIQASMAQTFRGSKMAGKANWIAEVHGDRAARIASHEDNLLQLFCEIEPLEIACESPFFNRAHPQAYGALVEILSAVRRAVMRYDSWKPLHLIDPPSVKNAVGVKGNKGGPEGKALMQRAVLALDYELNYTGQVPMDQLDEHSIDALAVAYCHYKTLKERLCL